MTARRATGTSWSAGARAALYSRCRALRKNVMTTIDTHGSPAASAPMAVNCDAPANTIALMPATSSGDSPASRAARPSTRPKPTPDAAIPRPSSRRRPRAAASSGTGSDGVVTGDAASAQEGLRAGPVADDVHGVLLGRVAGGVQQARTTGGGALPDPPAVVVVERGRLGLELVGEAVALGDERCHPRRPICLRLAGVRVVLADVRGHGSLPLRREAGGSSV